VFGVNTRRPAASWSHGDACATEPVRNGLCVDPELVGDVGQRHSGRVELYCLREGRVVPCRLFAVARDTVAVEVAGDGRSVDAELDGELVDGDAALVGIKKVVEVGGGETSLGRV